MKIILVLLDGLGDRSYEILDHQTPLQSAATPNLDRLASMGSNGLFHAASPGQCLPSETAHFRLFGYDTKRFPGRGLLEAVGDGVAFDDRDVLCLAHLSGVIWENNVLMLTQGPEVFHGDAQELEGLFAAITPYETHGIQFKLHQKDNRNDAILLEGAQGLLLDLDFGTYPYATSSSPVSAGACLGSGIAPNRLTHVIGVFKAYQTRVGAGPMPTELNDDIGNYIRELANEYGTVSGRPRRCGWIDIVAARFSRRINGFTSIAITRLDVLDKLPQLKICTGYKLNGEIIDNFPASIAALERCRTVYEDLPGWLTPTSHIRRYEELPDRAQQYIVRLEELLRCPVGFISVGPSREETIIRMSIF